VRGNKSFQSVGGATQLDEAREAVLQQPTSKRRTSPWLLKIFSPGRLMKYPTMNTPPTTEASADGRQLISSLMTLGLLVRSFLFHMLVSCCARARGY